MGCSPPYFLIYSKVNAEPKILYGSLLVAFAVNRIQLLDVCAGNVFMTAFDFKSVIQTDFADTESEKLIVESITEETIVLYFQALNVGNFDVLAKLFAPEGFMHPPFESGIVGSDAIKAYLEKEALGIKAYPRQSATQVLEDNNLSVEVTGKVETSWCGVNVLWQFILNPQRKIMFTKIKLLASPQELLNLKR